jgi:hypothetical protein
MPCAVFTNTMLRANDYPTLPMLMKSFMDAEKQHVIPHLIEEVSHFKAFVDGTSVVEMTHYKDTQMHSNSSSTKMVMDGK